MASVPTPADLAMSGLIVPFMELGGVLLAIFYHTMKQEKRH